MKISLLLHFHQPPTQFNEVTHSITSDCYLPIFNTLYHIPSAKLSVNITASLLEQLQAFSEGREVIRLIHLLCERGQIELTGTGAYHPLLPKIPDEEARRQILLQEYLVGKIVFDNSSSYRKKIGFFPPELAVEPEFIDLLTGEYYEWVMVDESAMLFGTEPGIYRNPDGLSIVVRDDTLSGAVAFGKVKSANDLFDLLNLSRRRYFALAMDGETFGHHLKFGIILLEDFFSDPRLDFCTISEVVKEEKAGKSGKISESTWGTTEDDLKAGINYPRWDIPKNKLHRLQWELTALVLQESVKIPESLLNPSKSLDSKLTHEETRCLNARLLLDKALHSDQYWWASANPCWHPDMVRRGAEMLKGVIFALPNASEKSKNRAEEIFEKLLKLGKEKFGDKAIFA